MRHFALLFVAAACAQTGCSSCGSSANDHDGDAGASSSPSELAAPVPSQRVTKDGGPVSAEPIPSGKVMQMVNPSQLAPYSGAVGTVRGHVYVTGDPPDDFGGKGLDDCATARETYDKTFLEADAGAGAKGRAMADAVVVVTGYTGFYLPETREAVDVKIEGCGFGARTFTMTFGQRLQVQNLTKRLLAPDLAQIQGPAMFLAAPMADGVRLYPPRPGRYDLISRRDAPWLHADVYVLLHPLHAASKRDGSFRIDGVPVGKRTVSVMHPGSSGVATAEVEVKTGAIVDVDLVIENKSRPRKATTPLLDDAGNPRPIPK